MDANYNIKGKIADLSSNPKITDQTEVYDYDEIKKRIYGDSRSVDVTIIFGNF